ncbi:hypothetical protein A0131_08805 [Staphylococcus kloosii]|uniref:BppU N-terminal domain-containing protein n=1 Tax=Staphylococcus kloosii TaxID=29384 RepID=A0A151A6E2_9STAP|nr:BppU family phage baseplate upper protein [Staphylococcus kloosii]KYH14873.1 hypothetical protein A0131_08805 [Staphylococcus kloosii]
MSMDKIANLQLETTAQYQSLSQLNVQFWNQDRETAILQFQITKNNYPLALSEENVKVFIVLESGDSFLVDDKLEFVDQLNGVVSYTIPDDFMKLATEVKGQVYVTTLDEEEVVVQRQFTFNVANDLIADLPAEDKIREIKYFSDMRSEVAQMMTKLNSDFEHMNDYVTQVQNTTQEGIARLTKLIDDKEKAYNDNHEAKMKELNTKGDEYSTKFDSDKQYMDEKFEAFKSSVNGSGLVTTGDSKSWQKVKLTQDTGTTLYDSNLRLDFNNEEQLSSLGVGTRYIASPLNPPNGTTANNGWLTKFDRGSIKYLEFRPYNSAQIFIKRYYNSWSDWELATPDYSKIETIQGSQDKATTAENNAKVYTDTKMLNDKTLIYNGSANGVGTDLNLSETLDNFVFLFIYGSANGVYFTATGNPMDNYNITVSCTNVIDIDGNGGGHYEALLSKTSRTKLRITNDVYFDFGSGVGSGANANKITINKIIGVRKYANIN